MININSVITASITLLVLSGCVSTGPKTGWIQKDAGTSTGIYVFEDGSRYEGGYLGETFNGNGMFFNQYDYYGNYPSTTNAPQIHGDTSSAKFNNGTIDNESITYTSRWGTGNKKISPEAFKYVGGYNKGFKGPGTITFGSGRVVKGQFDNESIPYAVAPNDRIFFKSSNLIGSYFEGPVSVKWPNGATFEGNAYRYYLFNRSEGLSNPKGLSCIGSMFFGKGVLKTPGQPDYVGVVTEDFDTYLPRRGREADLVAYAQEMAECPLILVAARKLITNAQANYDAEMAQGRENARASLARDLRNMSVNIKTNMTRVESASRGSTVELDREKARRNTEFNETRAKRERNNQVNENSKAVSASRTSTDDFEKEKSNRSSKSKNERLKSDKSENSAKIEKGSSAKNNSEPLIILRSTTYDVKPQIPTEKITMPDTSEKLVIPPVNKDYLTTRSDTTRPRTGRVMER
ncbi:hypothetical protein CTR2_R29750 [Comamonas thiooxydans]|uniref:hypothetical protein n=1 Tax=Comamonas thiooxydans TaxID=363952 RepID=UPI000A2DE269|nr:hypothetical protein [Comamonas thiooxydans]BDR09637.1 hypothetical protein CTR2_R29750 [Comamonas thiooxydans]